MNKQILKKNKATTYVHHGLTLKQGKDKAGFFWRFCPQRFTTGATASHVHHHHQFDLFVQPNLFVDPLICTSPRLIHVYENAYCLLQITSTNDYILNSKFIILIFNHKTKTLPFLCEAVLLTLLGCSVYATQLPNTLMCLLCHQASIYTLLHSMGMISTTKILWL